MPRWSSVLATTPLLLALGLAAHAEQVHGPPVGAARVRFAAATPTSTPNQAGPRGGTLIADAEGLWIAERVAGVVIRTDLEGRVQSSLSLHPGLGELIQDPRNHALFVADRSADRLVRIASSKLEVERELEIPEPHGLALTPDGATLLVTSVADHELVAVDTSSFTIRWRVELLAEPRAVAIAPDGNTALVGFLSSGALAQVDLESAGTKIRWHSLTPRDQVEIELVEDDWDGEFLQMTIEEANSRFEVPNDIGRRHARGVFTLAFLGEVAIVPHQLATPQLERRPQAGRRDSYGGGAEDIPPMAYQLGRIESPGGAGASEPSVIALDAAQPRALAWDAAHDVLYVGGYGNDRIIAFSKGSSANPTLRWSAQLDAGCGVDGVAPTPESRGLWVHCELTRKVVRIDFDDADMPVKSKQWLRSPELVASPRSAEVEWGAELFRRNGDLRISGGGVLACANCHPEGRNDGLSWRLGKSILQTPLLAGRVVGTAPYKWDGQDPNLPASIRHTVERLGGTATEMRRSEIAAIAAYLESLPAPRAPRVRDPEALARGQAVFEAECSGCHAGDHTTDQNQHALTTSLGLVDTPSLAGLAHTAPYYHDGSATDLRALIDDRANIHDMTDTSALSSEQRQDLVTYLESL